MTTTWSPNSVAAEEQLIDAALAGIQLGRDESKTRAF
jgi:hypothetical protein